MFKKLDQDARNQILETGIAEFAQNGLSRANINTIAERAGVSVGVIYKYYTDKDSFFLACVRHSLELLDHVLKDALRDTSDVKECIRKVIQALMKASREHSEYNVMYNEITSGSCRKYAAALAEEIEKRSSLVYAELFENAKEKGQVNHDINPKIFAFFFDNLLMMIQFSYSCEYYRERMKIFCEEDVLNDEELLANELLKFISAGIGLN